MLSWAGLLFFNLVSIVASSRMDSLLGSSMSSSHTQYGPLRTAYKVTAVELRMATVIQPFWIGEHTGNSETCTNTNNNE